MLIRLLPMMLMLLLAACTSLQEGSDTHFTGEKTFYLDSNLGFSWDYPSDWQRSGSGSPRAVRWTAPVSGEASSLRVEVIALPPALSAGGYRTLKKRFTMVLDEFTQTAERAIELEGGTPALEILGSTPDRSYLAAFVASSRHPFILSFSLPPEHFETYLPLFREMVSSFSILR